MTTLQSKLSAVGEVAPERPVLADTRWERAHFELLQGEVAIARWRTVNELAEWGRQNEALAARLAERLAAELKRCERCKGRGWFRGGHAETDFEVTCNDCKGRGRARA